MVDYTEVECFECPNCDEVSESKDEVFTVVTGYKVGSHVFNDDIYEDAGDIYEEIEALKCNECGDLTDPESTRQYSYKAKCAGCNKLYDDEDEAEECCKEKDKEEDKDETK